MLKLCLYLLLICSANFFNAIQAMHNITLICNNFKCNYCGKMFYDGSYSNKHTMVLSHSCPNREKAQAEYAKQQAKQKTELAKKTAEVIEKMKTKNIPKTHIMHIK